MTALPFQTVANNAPVISRYEADNVSVELSFRRLGAMVELVATRVEEHISGLCHREELGREVVDAEDAENAACDLAWIATDSMKASGLDYGPAFPLGFGEAVEKELEADPAADRAYLVAAVAHNAALIAAE